MTQTFANAALTTLQGALSASALTVSVGSMTTFKDPTGAALVPPFAIQIDNELLLVTGISGTTLTVARGHESTTATTHAAGAPVTAPITAGGLQNLIRLEHVGAATATGGLSGDWKLGTNKIWVNDAGTWKSASFTPPATNGFYLSPTGSDAGTGAIGSPWRTVNKFAQQAGPGDTLYCRGGTYTNTNTAAVYGISGTPTQPITITNYPGETPIFQGLGASPARFLHLRSGSSYWVVDGIQLQDFNPSFSGVIWIGDDPPVLSTHHHIIRNCRMTARAGGTTSDQLVYLSALADDVTVEYNRFIGASVNGDGGTATNMGDHEPGPVRFMIRYNIMTGFGDTGAIWVNSNNTNGSILHNTFRGNFKNIRLMNHAAVLVRDNAGETGSRGALYGNIEDTIDPSFTTADHNFWGQQFDANNLLLAGQTGRGAASDGTDAGALDW